MTSTIVPPALAQELQLLTASQFQKILGIGPATFWRWKALHKIPRAIDFGGATAQRTTLRWRATEIQAWIAAGCPDGKTWDARRAAG